MQTHPVKAKKSGFTLIELLVVMSIIALLVSILLPGLSSARQMAKRAQCMSNMRQVTIAMSGYVLEFSGFPILMTQSGAGVGWATWTYGGWGGRNRAYWQGQAGGMWNIPTERRPLSAYMLMPPNADPGKEGPGPDNVWGTTDDRYIEMKMFECPNDFGSRQGEFWDTALLQDASRITGYDDVGTSYHMNMAWYFTYPGTLAQRVAIGHDLWRRKLTQDASRFLTVYEDPFDRAINEGATNGSGPTGTLTMGFHRQFSKHVMGYLDGHVEYSKVNTKKCRGPNWTVVDEWRSWNCSWWDHRVVHPARR
jgi:prepilin-type N-terminal cleavage/methylation domain-containing protein